MGVRGLQTFVEKHCPPDCCYEVSIKELVEEYRKETNIEQPTIVVDGSSCLRFLYGDLDWVCGGQFKEYFENVRRFVNAFKELGVHLVFFFGGFKLEMPLSGEERTNIWTERLKLVHDLFDALRRGVPTHKLNRWLFRLPTSLGHSFYFSELFGCEVQVALDETEMASFARDNNCLAVFGQDSDLIIYGGGKFVLTARDFNLQQMKTKAYNRERFASFLGLHPSQLPVFATLAGSNNGVVNYKRLSAFHKSLNPRAPQYWRYEILYPALANYVKQLPKGEDLFEALPSVATEVFNSPTAVLAEYLATTVRHYMLISPAVKFAIECDDPNWNAICRKAEELHRANINTQVILNILMGKPFTFSVMTEDLRNSDFPPAASLLHLLRRRMCGILLKEKPANTEPRLVQEWCMAGPNSLDHPTEIEPIPPADQHPGMLALWGEDRSPEMQTFRWQLFSHAVSPRLDYSDLLTLPTEYMILPVAALVYLVEQKLFKSWEIEALLATTIMLPSVSLEYLSNLSADPVNLRAVHIATIFIRSMVTVVRLLSVCGYPLSISQVFAHPYFDGKLFQEKYRKAKDGAAYEELCDQENTAMQLFLQVEEILTESENAISDSTL